MASKSSLYQLVDRLPESPVSIRLSPITLFYYVANIFELLIEQNLSAKIWVKSPQTRDWSSEIKRYQSQGKPLSISLCESYKDSFSKTFISKLVSSPSLNTLVLEPQDSFQQECFLLVLSEQFSGLIIAQWQEGKITVETSGKRLEKPYLKAIVSFNNSVIQTFVSSLKERTVSKEQRDIFRKIEFQEKTEQNLLTTLLIKQIKQSESIDGFKEKNINNFQNKSLTKISPDIGINNKFLHNLIEELRGPVTHMKTALSLLGSKQVKGEQRQLYLEMLDTQCDRQNALITGLLELLQLDRDIDRQTVYLNELVPGVVSTYQPLASEKQIQLGYTIPANLPPVYCPTSWLRQMLVQLLSNALQFTNSDGRVFVRASLKKDYIELVVTDTGIGISSQELNRIFDSFYRTKNIIDRQVTGVGLGLTIVRHLIDRCGGSISVTSKVNKGSSFRLLLPVLPSELVNN